jgi:hypothetical protein
MRIWLRRAADHDGITKPVCSHVTGDLLLAVRSAHVAPRHRSDVCSPWSDVSEGAVLTEPRQASGKGTGMLKPSAMQPQIPRPLLCPLNGGKSVPICTTSHPRSHGSDLFHCVVLIAWSLYKLDLKICFHENEGHVTGLLIGKSHYEPTHCC